MKTQPRHRVRSGGPGEKRAGLGWLPGADFWGRVGRTSDTRSRAARGISCYGRAEEQEGLDPHGPLSWKAGDQVPREVVPRQ